MISLLLVEHPESVRHALSERLALEIDLVPSGEVGDVSSAVALVARRRPNIIVLDAEMPGLDLQTAVHALRAQSPGSKIVVLSLDTAASFRRLGDDGCATVVGKHQGIEALLAAIRGDGHSPTEPRQLQG